MLASARWELLWTSVGLKAVMAVSGAVLSGWVLLHRAETRNIAPEALLRMA